MDNNKKNQLQEELKERNNGTVTGNEVIFDPLSGELVVANAKEGSNPDGTVVSQITEDGFA